MKVLNYFNALKIDKMLGIHRGYAFIPAQNRGKECLALKKVDS